MPKTELCYVVSFNDDEKVEPDFEFSSLEDAIKASTKELKENYDIVKFTIFIKETTFKSVFES